VTDHDGPSPTPRDFAEVERAKRLVRAAKLAKVAAGGVGRCDPRLNTRELDALFPDARRTRGAGGRPPLYAAGQAKPCTRCKETKDPDAFPPRRDAADGRGSWCRACRNQDHRGRRRAGRDAPARPVEGYVRPTEKPCTRCEKTKPLSAYGPNREMRDGCDSWCRRCRSAACLASYYRRKAAKGAAADHPGAKQHPWSRNDGCDRG
jgi:hypothetical protein